MLSLARERIRFAERERTVEVDEDVGAVACVGCDVCVETERDMHGASSRTENDVGICAKFGWTF